MKKKILIAQFHHETNSSCPLFADEIAYKNYRFDVGEKVFDNQRGLGTELGAFLDVFEKRDDIELIPAVALNAAPSGPVTSEVYDFATDEIIRVIEENTPLDGVLLTLHGAMVAQEHDDGEGDLLETIRAIIGEGVPIVASLDLHANVTRKMARCANVLVPYECYPHTDTYETGLVAARIMEDTLDGKLNPIMAYRRIPFLLPMFPADFPEIKPLYDFTSELNKYPGTCCVRFAHGFFPSDIEEMGMTVMAVTDGDKRLAENLADKLEAAIRENIPRLEMKYPSLDEALARAVIPGDKPVVLADASDNPGAGGLSDTTHILRRVIDKGITGAVFATIVDPSSVEKCEAAGVGSMVELYLGGLSKQEYSGGPLNVMAYVKMLTDGKYVSREKISYGEIINHGKTAVVQIAGNVVLITSIPRQPWDIEIFRSHGIRPEEQRIIVTKSTVHYRASYSRIAREMIAVALPGYAVPVPQGYKFSKWKNNKQLEDK